MSEMQGRRPGTARAGNLDWVLLTTHRSGSTWLSALIDAQGVAGHPSVLLPNLVDHGPRIRFLTDIRGAGAFEMLVHVSPAKVPHADVIAEARATGTTENGVFGTKLMWPDLLDLGFYFDRDPDTALLRLLTPELRCVRLIREDKDAQAVSYFKALQTGEWQADAEGAPERDWVYDFEMINFIHDVLCHHEEAWTRWCDDNRIEPHVLTYAELAREPEATLRRVLGFIGVELEGPLRPASMRRQADEHSLRWLERFRDDRRRYGITRSSLGATRPYHVVVGGQASLRQARSHAGHDSGADLRSADRGWCSTALLRDARGAVTARGGRCNPRKEKGMCSEVWETWRHAERRQGYLGMDPGKRVLG